MLGGAGTLRSTPVVTDLAVVNISGALLCASVDRELLLITNRIHSLLELINGNDESRIIVLRGYMEAAEFVVNGATNLMGGLL